MYKEGTTKEPIYDWQDKQRRVVTEIKHHDPVYKTVYVLTTFTGRDGDTYVKSVPQRVLDGYHDWTEQKVSYETYQEKVIVGYRDVPTKAIDHYNDWDQQVQVGTRQVTVPQPDKVRIVTEQVQVGTRMDWVETEAKAPAKQVTWTGSWQFVPGAPPLASIADAKRAWWQACANMDKAGMDAAEAAAKQLRDQGATIDPALTAQINAEGMALLNSTLKQAQRDYWNATFSHRQDLVDQAEAKAKWMRDYGASDDPVFLADLRNQALGQAISAWWRDAAAFDDVGMNKDEAQAAWLRGQGAKTDEAPLIASGKRLLTTEWQSLHEQWWQERLSNARATQQDGVTRKMQDLQAKLDRLVGWGADTTADDSRNEALLQDALKGPGAGIGDGGGTGGTGGGTDTGDGGSGTGTGSGTGSGGGSGTGNGSGTGGGSDTGGGSGGGLEDLSKILQAQNDYTAAAGRWWNALANGNVAAANIEAATLSRLATILGPAGSDFIQKTHLSYEALNEGAIRDRFRQLEARYWQDLEEAGAEKRKDLGKQPAAPQGIDHALPHPIVPAKFAFTPAPPGPGALKVIGAGGGAKPADSGSDKLADANRQKALEAELQAAINSAPVDAGARATLNASIQATLQQVADPEKARILDQFRSTQSQVILAIQNRNLVMAQALLDDMQWMTLATGIAAPGWTQDQLNSLGDAINNGIVAARTDWWAGLASASKKAVDDALDQSAQLRNLAKQLGVTPKYAEGAPIPVVDDNGRRNVFAAAKQVYADMLADSPDPATASARWQFLRDQADYWLKGHVSEFADPIRSDLQQAEYRRWHALIDDNLSLPDRRTKVDSLDLQIDQDAGVVKALGLGDLLSDGATQQKIKEGKAAAVAYADALAAQLNAGTDHDTRIIQSKLDFLKDYGIEPTIPVPGTGGTGVVDGTPAQSADDLAKKFSALGWTAMCNQADRIWDASQKYHVQAELLAALIMQESGGRETLGVDTQAGLGLMQIEWSAHKDDPVLLTMTQCLTEAQRKAWLIDPDHNLDYGVGCILQPELQQYGSDGDGLLRALMAWNYGSASEDIVDSKTQSDRDDWEYQLWLYHATHDGSGNDVSMDSPDSYGNAIHFFQVRRYLDQLLGKEQKPESAANGDRSWPVELFKQTDPTWGEILLNKSNGEPDKWKNEGCTLTCLAMLVHYYTGVEVDVHLMRLLRLYCTDEWESSNGYTDNNGDVQWNSRKFNWFLSTLGVKVPGPTHIAAGPENYGGLLQNLKNMLKDGPVILGGMGKTGWHWIVVKGYQGSGDSRNDFQINDPYNDFATLNQYLDKYPEVTTLVQMQHT